MSNDRHPRRETKESNSESENVAKLRSLIQGLESESILANHSPRDRKGRLLRIREEIARMLSGASVTQEARAQAARLLDGAGVGTRHIEHAAARTDGHG